MESTVDDLVARAVEVARDVTGPKEYEAVWQILHQAAEDGRASLLAGTRLLGSSDPVVRSVGCDLLGCVSDLHEPVRADAASALLRLAPSETDVEVNWSIASALGSTADERAVPILVALAGHSDADIRFQVAHALPSVATGNPDGAEIGALIRLTGDPDPEVRNWATFGLGSQIDIDTPAVRDALWARVGDDGGDVHGEAVFGLARRRDLRATALLIELLDAEEGIHTWAFDAAACLRDPALLPHLINYDPADPLVAMALLECDPEARAGRDEFAAALFDTVHRRFQTAEPALFADRFEPGLTLEMTLSGRTFSWSVDALVKRTLGDLERAADLIAHQLTRPGDPDARGTAGTV
jgi:HEAT repeat protein